MEQNLLFPHIGVVTDIRRDTPDVKTFRVNAIGGGKCFEHIPGQCAMLSIPGKGEAMFSITSSPTNREYMEFSIKKCGCLTTWLHLIEVGQELTIRGPYGNGFPVDTEFAGKDLVFVAGGIGLAPLRSVINYIRDNRDKYGTVDIVYGSRSKDDLVDYPEITNEWMKEPGFNVHLTIDRPQDGWDGHVGFVPNYVKELNFDTSKTVVMVRTSHHDKVHSCRTQRAGLQPRAGLDDDGASHEMRYRQVRTLQHRLKVRLQRRPRVQLCRA